MVFVPLREREKISEIFMWNVVNGRKTYTHTCLLACLLTYRVLNNAKLMRTRTICTFGVLRVRHSNTSFVFTIGDMLKECHLRSYIIIKYDVFQHKQILEKVFLSNVMKYYLTTTRTFYFMLFEIAIMLNEPT